MPSAANDNPNLYARQGEVVTCENGHAVCDVMVDLPRHGTVMAQDFGNHRQGQIVFDAGTPVDDCRCHCGSRFARSWTTRVNWYSPWDIHVDMHFSDGWRR